jgi:hypothetical protein
VAAHLGECRQRRLRSEAAVRADRGDPEPTQPVDRLDRRHPGERLRILVERQLRDDRKRRHVLHRRDRRLELVELEERLDHEEVDSAALEQPRLLEEDGVGVLPAGRPLEVAEGPDRARHEHRHARDLTRLARQLHAALDDLLHAVVEELRRELSPVRPERVRLDHVGAGADEPLVDRDHGLGGLQVRLLRTAEARDGRGQHRAGAAVRDDDVLLVQTLKQPAHRASA